MGTLNKAATISTVIFLLSFFNLIQCNGNDKLSIKGKDWKLNIHSFQAGLTSIPVIGGLVSISAKNGQEGVIIKGEIHPTINNESLVIDLKDFKMLVGDKEFTPATADVTRHSKSSLESIQWPAVHSSALDKNDFPASISIMFLVTKNQKKTLIVTGGNPIPLSTNN